MPAFNAERTIGDAIVSILDQTEKEWELIIVDDGSIDGTRDIINSFNDSRIKYISQANQGPGVARNTGLQNTKGEYVLFVDSDDALHPQYLDILLENIVSYSADVSMCSYEKIRREKYYKNRGKLNKSKGNSRNEILSSIECINLMFYKRKVMPYSVLKLYSRKIIGENRYPSEVKLGEDLEFNLQIMKNAERIVFCPQKLYYHITNDYSITNDLEYSVALTHFCRLQEMLVNENSCFSEAIKCRLFVLSFDLLSRNFRGANKENELTEKCKCCIKKYMKSVFANDEATGMVRLLAFFSSVSIPFSIGLCRVLRKVNLRRAV